MGKDFRNWHKIKTQIDNVEQRPFFHEKEIWFCYLGLNVGFEQDGRGRDSLRPVLIFKKFNNEFFWGIPLTKSKKKGIYYFNFSFIDKVNSVALLSQMKPLDGKRLSRKIGDISNEDWEIIKEKIKKLLP